MTDTPELYDSLTITDIIYPRLTTDLPPGVAISIHDIVKEVLAVLNEWDFLSVVPKEVTAYPKGAVTRAAELQAEDEDESLHHHEVTHSHPFTDLEHTHDQPKLDDREKE